MYNKRISFLTVFVLSSLTLLLFSHSLFALQTYTQNVDRDGNSKVIRTADLFKSIFKDGAFDRMKRTCSDKLPALDCTIDNTTVNLHLDLFANSGHYTYSVDYGIIFITYKLTLNYVPSDRFGDQMYRLVTLSNASDYDFRAKSIDLRRDNTALSKSELAQPYIIKMPAQIVEASAGATKANINGNSAEFDLTKVYGESKPIVVIAQELNWSYLIIILAVLIFIGMSLMFFRKPKKVPLG